MYIPRHLLLLLILFGPCEAIFPDLPSVSGLFDFRNPFDTIKKKKLRCLFKAVLLNIDLSDFDRFDDFFRDDSVIELAQAGTFTGVNSIREYVGFASTISPFVSSSVGLDNLIHVIGYDEDSGQCEFLAMGHTRYETTSETSVSKKFDVPVMLRLFVDFDDNYITRANVFFHEEYLKFIFGEVLAGPRTHEFVCTQILDEACNDLRSDCISELSSLPTVGTIAAEFDGNTQGCRAMHATFAANNPGTHCAHVSLTEKVDPNGKVLCQKSENIAVSSLFTKASLDIFEEFQKDNEVDPDIGFVLL